MEKETIEEPKNTCPKCRTTDFDDCHSINCPMKKEELKFKNRQMGAAGFVANKIMENMISKFKKK